MTAAVSLLHATTHLPLLSEEEKGVTVDSGGEGPKKPASLLAVSCVSGHDWTGGQRPPGGMPEALGGVATWNSQVGDVGDPLGEWTLEQHVPESSRHSPPTPVPSPQSRME